MNTTEETLEASFFKLQQQFKEYVQINEQIRDLANKYFWALEEIVKYSYYPGDTDDVDAYADLKDIARKALGIE